MTKHGGFSLEQLEEFKGQLLQFCSQQESTTPIQAMIVCLVTTAADLAAAGGMSAEAWNKLTHNDLFKISQEEFGPQATKDGKLPGLP